MSSSRNSLFAALALLPLCGCGFTPLYGQSGNTTVAEQLDLVDVANIPDRPGQLLRLSLETQLHTAGAPGAELYSLNVTYNIGTAAIGIQSDTSATRNRFDATANWVLTPIGSPGTALAKGNASTEDAANIIDQQYFALTQETETINQQLADQLAAQITTQLATYFKTHPTQG